MAADVLEIPLRQFMGDEAIHMKDARAMDWAVRRTGKNVNTHHSRCRLLCDNMGVVGAFERRRAHVLPLLQQVCLFSAHGMASGSFYSLRWIQSEANPSDLPSMRFEHIISRHMSLTVIARICIQF